MPDKIKIAVIESDCLLANGICRVIESFDTKFEVKRIKNSESFAWGLSYVNVDVIIFDFINNLSSFEPIVENEIFSQLLLTIVPVSDDIIEDILYQYNISGILTHKMNEEQIYKEIINSLNRKNRFTKFDLIELDNFSLSEIKVYLLKEMGLKNQNIADRLKLSKRTIESHIYNIKQKLNQFRV